MIDYKIIPIIIRIQSELAKKSIYLDDVGELDEGGVMIGFKHLDNIRTVDLYNDGDIIYMYGDKAYPLTIEELILIISLYE